MNQSKLVSILKALEEKEFKQFQRYIDSPFYTQSTELLKLFDYLSLFYPDFDSPKLEKENVFKHLYPDEKFNSPRLRNLIFKINKILEEFLIYLEFQQNEFNRKKLLNQIYSKRNLNVIFKKKTEELFTILKKQPYRDTAYYYENYLLSRDFYFHLATNKDGNTVEYIKSSLGHLNNFYAIERLRLGIDLVNRERIYNESHNFKVDDFGSINSTDNILYHLLLQVFDLLTTDAEAYFYKVKENFLKNINALSRIDAQMILLALLNYAIQQIPKSENIFLKEVFELYKLGMNNSIFINEGYLHENTFLNITLTGSKLKEFKWVNNFIEMHQNKLDTSIKEDVVVLARCYLSFIKSDYLAVPTYLQNLQFKDSLYKITAKSILIRSYYMLFEKDKTYGNLVLSNCKAFDKFVERERSLNIKKKKPYLNFSFLLKKIVHHKLGRSNLKGINFSTMLNNFPTVFAKSWLQEIIENYTQKKIK